VSLSKRIRFAVLTRDRFTCRYCGRSAPAVVLHVDHVHPVSRGGSDDESNLVTACVECNSSKSDKILQLFPLEALVSAVPAEPTFPHPDRCRACGNRFVETREEIPATDGYHAFYACECGHTWRTYWGAHHRLTERQLADVRSEHAYLPTSIAEQSWANATPAFESLARGVEPRFGDPRG
jgi:HNH endonuclease